MDLKAELQLKEPPSEIMFGTAKKFTLELEKWPLHTQTAIISMMNMMAQHRKATMDITANNLEQEARDKAMEEARQAHARNQAAEEDRRNKNAQRAERAGIDPNTGGIKLVGEAQPLEKELVTP